MIRSILASFTILFLVSTTSAPIINQVNTNEPTYFSQTYGGSWGDRAYSVVQTVDGGYTIAGTTSSFGAGLADFWLVKTDVSGNHEWNQTYGGVFADQSFSIVQTVDGGYALAGYTESFGAGNVNFWLVKTDVSGNHEWNQTYGGQDYDYAYSIVQTVDGGYALAGYTESFGAGSFDSWLVKTDASGNHEWNQTYGGSGDDYAYSVVQTIDEGYASVGNTRSVGSGNANFSLVKTDVSGNHEWNQTYGGADRDRAYSIVQTVDGGYTLAGYTESFGAGSFDSWLVKTDASGNHEWNQTYGGSGDDYAYSVVQTIDGGYVLAGGTWSFGAGLADFWLVKTDASGNHEWNQTYGGLDNDYSNSVVQTVDGGYVLAGGTRSFGAGGSDSWLVKTDASGNLKWSQTYGGAGFQFTASVFQTFDGGYAMAGYTMFLRAGDYDFWLVKTDQNGNIPEFPTWTLILLVVILLVAIIFTVAITIYKQRARET